MPRRQTSRARYAEIMSDLRNPGDAWVTAHDGGRYWGRFGAAGLLAYDRDRDASLPPHRVAGSDYGDTWGSPGGARHEGESAGDAAIRESQEEAGVPADAVTPRYTHVLDRGGWTYTTLIADVKTPFEPEITDPESHALAWVPLDEVDQHNLHPAFATSWQLLRPLLRGTPTVVVDAANVIVSVPNGWWKDRRAAAEGLRDRIDALVESERGVRPGFFDVQESAVPGIDRAHPEWIMVVEGVARGIGNGTHVRVVDAPELGDDEIVAQIAAATARGANTTVVTSDVELQTRSHAAGAKSRGVRTLLQQLPDLPEPLDDPAEPALP